MDSLLSLKDKVALVTGASRGIGAQMAATFAAAGAHVVLTAQEEGAMSAQAAALETAHGIRTLVHAGDVTEAASVQALYATVHKTFGRLDILAANAGILIDGMLGMFRPEDIRRTLDVNVAGVIHHLQHAPRLMKRTKSGSIIITSSIIGRVGNKGQAVYAASKAALIGVTLSAARELGSDGIRVNALAPGLIETDMTRNLSPAVRQKHMDGIALGRTGTPEDVARVALFLACDLSRYVSGQVIGVDGGMVI